MTVKVDLPIPSRLFTDLAWSFEGLPYDNICALSEDVRQYQVEIRGSDKWIPDKVVIGAPSIFVQFPETDMDDQTVSSQVQIFCDDGRAFHACELLFKVHNLFVQRVRGTDEYFLEGLTLVTKNVMPPVYRLDVGS